MSNTAGGGWRNPDYGFDAQGALGGLGGLLGGLFGNPGGPYDDAMQQYQQWMNKAQGVQQPYVNAGTGALGDYQKWLQGQQDPAKFMNNLTNQYQESPYTKFLQQQSMRAGQNAASADGTMGSTPFVQQMQNNAGNIAAGGMNDWLKNVLGINTQYGQGQQDLVHGGQNSANSLANMYNQMGQRMGDAAYGKRAGQQQDMWNTIGGGLSMVAPFL